MLPFEIPVRIPKAPREPLSWNAPRHRPDAGLHARRDCGNGQGRRRVGARTPRPEMILGNTYHLLLRPGAERISRLGGLHRLMGWTGPILTDSEGFRFFLSLVGGRWTATVSHSDPISTAPSTA